jgi:GH18 family chitinase
MVNADDITLSYKVQITWDDQWIGFDNEASILEKINWANGHCFGGTMLWSIDLDSGSGSSAEPPTSTDGTCVSGGLHCSWRVNVI